MRPNRRESIRNLSISIRPYTGEMFLAIFSALLKQVSSLGTVALTAYIVGTALEGQLQQRASLLVTLLIVCILLRALAYYGEMYFGHDVAFRVIRDFRIDIFQKICDLAPAYTLRRQTGQLGQSLVDDVGILELFLAHTFGNFIVSVVVTVTVLIVLLTISPLLSLVLLVAAILMGMVPYIMRKRADQQGFNVRERLAESNAMLVESVQGLREITTLNSKEAYQKKIDRGMDSLYQSQLLYGKRKGIEAMMSHVLTGVFVVAVMTISSFMVARGDLEFSLYPVAIMLSTVVLAPISEVTSVAQELGLVFAAANRIQAVLHEEPAVQNLGTETLSAEGKPVAFRNVSFRYSEDAEEVLHDVSFVVEPGETAVLVGHSGAGKTTCANLLLRYWDPVNGSVEIGGENIQNFTMESLREAVSAVQQDPFLFHTTVRDNIRLGSEDASDEAVLAASKAANAHEFICGLPEGYETVTGERGFRLSGGQRQRIAIARALLRDTPVVIFDEAVSNLDTENEYEIQETLKTLLKGKTVLMIAHRLSTILSAGKVIMLENGKVVAIGTHDELIETCAPYRDLLGSQLYGTIEGLSNDC